MIPTHILINGKHGSPVRKNSVSSTAAVDPCDKSIPELDHYLSTSERKGQQSWRFGKTTKYVLFALLVFFGQIAISVTLKRYGFIVRDFNEIVAERVVPRLQSQLKQTGFRMPQFNESLYWLQNLNQTLPAMNYISQEPSRPGYQLAQKGAHAKYPIVMVPGFVTSGLEVWQGKRCAKELFRQRVWGGVGMVQHWLMERHCVMEHMALDPLTGMDPENIRIRASTGFEAADYFAGNYWVWSKLLENLADIGYDGSMMSMESYDWRLSFPKLEERDGYLTKLRYRIEAFYKASGKKVVLTSHSLGGILVHYFFAWVATSEKLGGGGGGKDWVDKHIHAYINIAGPQLGVPKAASALLSGEMSDTVFLGAAGTLLEQFLGRRVRKDLWTTWGSLWSMLPKGGDSIWTIGADFNEYGESEMEKMEYFEGNGKHHLLQMTDSEKNDDDYIGELDYLTCERENLVDSSSEAIVNDALKDFVSRNRHTVEEVNSFLTKWGGGSGPGTSAIKMNSFDMKAKPSKSTWHDISRTPLPSAPNMKIYCLYGVGVDTERSYYYKRNTGESQSGSDNSSKSSATNVDPPFILDNSVEDEANKVFHGVKYVDGDGSVPLLSLGYMCADGWRRRETGLNPGKTEVVTREYIHRQEIVIDDPMRGGPYSADHVDVMGNLHMMNDLLRIVSDHDVETVKDSIVSNINKIASAINNHPKGGLKKRRRWKIGRR